jgi:cellulose synthase/poly-beta-1,6-N-acetylglucosamine synthase-like glycosyltransferase
MLGVAARSVAVAAGVLAASGLLWLPATDRWTIRGHLAWAATVYAGVAYLLYMAEWTLGSDLGLLGLLGGAVLWLLELATFLLSLAYVWEMIDVLATRAGRRRSPPAAQELDRRVPFVSLHVPAHNEPPEMVIATLASLLALDYPAFEIVMVDDNTTDPGLWHPVAHFCAHYPDRIRFHHLEDWPGYKSGALNFALTVTDPRASLIGVVDADYLVEPDWLRRCTPMFADKHVAFVQAPQDYRGWEHSSYYRRLYYSYDYFFRVSQPSRDQRDGAIFGGTMGLLRRSALEQVGGWAEWCITEDAELSLRLLKDGWSGRHVGMSFGRGVMPLTFEALKRQRFRWCFGGIQILRRHWRSLLLWTGDRDNRLTLGQRWAYLSGGLQWFVDLLGLVFTAFLVTGAIDAALGGGALFRRLSGFVLAAIPALMVLGLVRAIALLRCTTRASWRDAFGAFFLWLALGWVVATACVRGLVEPGGVFLRTPKTREDADWRDAVTANRAEIALAVTAGLSGLAAVGFGHGPGRIMLAALLAAPVVGWLAAPVNSVAALRADLPEQLLRRRRTEWLRAWTTSRIRPLPVAATVAVAALVGLLLLALAPGRGVVPARPDVLHEARGRAAVGAPTAAPADHAAAEQLTPAATSTATTTTASATARSTSIPTPTATAAPGSSPPIPTAPSTTQPGAASTTAAPTPTTRSTGQPTELPTPSSRPTPSRSPRPRPTGTPPPPAIILAAA